MVVPVRGLSWCGGGSGGGGGGSRGRLTWELREAGLGVGAAPGGVSIGNLSLMEAQCPSSLTWV